MKKRFNPFLGGLDFAPDQENILIEKIANESISAIKAVFSFSSTEVRTSSSTVSGRQDVFGISVTGAVSGATVLIQTDGVLEDALFSGFTPGSQIFIDSNGSLTETIPTSGFLFDVGVYIGENKVSLNIKRPIIL